MEKRGNMGDMKDERMKFRGKVALITGSGAGIGAETAKAFAKEGCAVIIMDSNQEAAREIAALIEGQGGKAFPITGDVRNPSDCESAVQAAVTRFGGLDIVFCNAGVYEGGTAESQTEASWDLQVDTMLKGTFLTCKYAIPVLRKRGGGSIILSGSNCSHIGCSGRFAYTAAKSAMPILARQLSNDYYHTAKIRTNCVSPGYVRTPMTEKIWREQTRTPAEVPFPESLSNAWQKPEAISSTVLFLASEEASDITGVTIPVSRTALWRVAAQK